MSLLFFPVRACLSPPRLRGLIASLLAAGGLLACGGGGHSPTEVASPAKAATTDRSELQASQPGALGGSPGWALHAVEGVPPVTGRKALASSPTTQVDAVRLANQGTFGATEALIQHIRQTGPLLWVAEQMSTSRSLRGTIRPQVAAPDPTPAPSFGLHKPLLFSELIIPTSALTSGGTGAVHQFAQSSGEFCDGRGDNCWRDWSSSTPLVWDFYRNAVSEPDQLRQRVGWALQQILVVSNLEVFGTYGLRNYNNALLNQAFGNYRDVLRSVALSPVMGDYLNNVNNDKAAPNENFARELLQLFSLGTCALNTNGTLKSGDCEPTYDNEMVRNYAFALTGWTYPAGGATPWGCWPRGSNCQYYGGDMVPVASFHDSAARALLSGVNLPSGHNPGQALEAVLNSLMNHPNMAPFVGRQLIQHLVTSNPSPAYVQRVASAFVSGRFQGFGTGQRGDMKATVAAILLDAEARTTSPSNTAGRLREPAQFFTGVLRALNGRTDGDALGWWWGEELRQHAFRSPSVFNFYPPDYPVAGTSLVGPAFALHSTNAALQRVNYVNYLVFWDGSDPQQDVPGALGTRVDLSPFVSDAGDPGKLVDRLSLLALGAPLPTAARMAVVNAVAAYTQQTSGNNYLTNRVRQAAYLVFASPNYQVVH
ncbi:hypothetical protein LPB72_20385 [Hydrogenophaga crassostreae]|uniref:DUF1800 domain-containing protein n=1 Tax=Hydrogenophaga crassostreae TaxID=1763535 RepID=A0ABX2U1A9_9BURK|nr:DUF1800 family protein [Hydrogenophaga crassostreae]OAD39623.1 hypothetical protein LPB72_20385 [Hydrogenophaga crassostreae]